MLKYNQFVNVHDCYIACVHLTDSAATKLKWDLSNMNVIQRLCGIFVEGLNVLEQLTHETPTPFHPL